MGKSKIALDILKYLKDENPTLSVLLLTNSETLRDVNWKAEFEKFGLDYLYASTVSECYQTVYKWKDKIFDLVIADEIDFALTPMYQQFFSNNTCNMILGLTGFCSEEKKDLLNQIAPICFEYTTQQGQEENLLNKSEIVILRYDLSKKFDISIKKKAGGSFNTSENALYIYYDKALQKAIIAKSALEKKVRLGITVDPKLLTSADWNFKMMATKRKSVLNNSNSSVTLVKNIVANIHSRPGNKVLIFSALTAQADKLGFPTYHGKPNSTESGLDRINSGEIKTLAVCKAINRGVNLIGVNYIVRESFDSSETDFMQTHGRLMRLDPGQVAKYIIPVPYFEDLVRTPEGGFKKMKFATQASKWSANMMMSYDPNSLTTIDIGQDLKIPNGVQL